jgi:hypothetical protein
MFFYERILRRFLRSSNVLFEQYGVHYHYIILILKVFLNREDTKRYEIKKNITQ